MSRNDFADGARGAKSDETLLSRVSWNSGRNKLPRFRTRKRSGNKNIFASIVRVRNEYVRVYIVMCMLCNDDDVYNRFPRFFNPLTLATGRLDWRCVILYFHAYAFRNVCRILFSSAVARVPYPPSSIVPCLNNRSLKYNTAISDTRHKMN